MAIVQGFNFREINERAERAKAAMREAFGVSDLAKMQEVEAEWKRLVELDPNNFLLHYWLARTYELLADLSSDVEQRHGYLQTGIVSADKAVQLNEGHAGAHLVRSSLCGHMVRATKGGLVKWGREAGAELARAERLHPDDAYYHLVAGRAAIFCPALFGGSYRTAVEHLMRAVGLDPDDPAPATWLAIALAKQGEADRARQAIAKVVERWPKFSHGQSTLKRMEAAEELVPG